MWTAARWAVPELNTLEPDAPAAPACPNARNVFQNRLKARCFDTQFWLLNTVFPVGPNGASIAPGMAPSGEEGRIMLLSDKELVILQMLSRGMSNKAIGDALFISNKTVSTYKSRIQEKLGVSSLAALIEFASLHKLIS